MSFYECLTAFVFVSVTTLLGQEGQGSAAWARLQRIDRVLRSAHSSGSLVYQGYCGNTLPEAPPVRSLSDDSGAPIAVLQKMLGNPPDVLVTQEPNGMVRMVQTNVPTDLLDLRIQHMAFYGSSDDGSQGPWHGANMAVIAILMNPEVRAFRKEHDIGPDGDSFPFPGDSGSNKPIVRGYLENVTVSEALDYITKTFPGFWIYENCVDKTGNRTVRLGFYERH